MIVTSLIILLAYLCYTVWVGRSIPESLSATYYILGKKGWMFQLTMASTAFALLPSWLEATPDTWQHLPFLACAGLLFVAAAPAFRLRLDGIVHYSSAVLCGVCAVLWMFLSGYGDIFAPCFVGAITMSLFYPKKYMWWLEVAIVISLFCSLAPGSF